MTGTPGAAYAQRMIDNGVNADIHLSQVATWALNTIGRAFLLSSIVAIVIGGAGAVGGTPFLIYLAAVLAPLVFGATLWFSSAPLPDVQ